MLIERKMSAAVEVAHLVEAEVADRDKIFMMVDFFTIFFQKCKTTRKSCPFYKNKRQGSLLTHFVVLFLVFFIIVNRSQNLVKTF